MKIQDFYQQYLLNGEWHIHTSYTDGKLNVNTICRIATDLKIPLIAFTEHVRKRLTYDFDKFIWDIETARKQYSNLIILIGCEAKVLDLEGSLDVENRIIDKCDIVLGAFHGFQYKSKDQYLTSLINMINNQIIDIWAHPTLFLKKRGLKLSIDEIDMITKHCKASKILIEKNAKYELPDDSFISVAQKNGCSFTSGTDIHSIDDFSKINNLNPLMDIS